MEILLILKTRPRDDLKKCYNENGKDRESERGGVLRRAVCGGPAQGFNRHLSSMDTQRHRRRAFYVSVCFCLLPCYQILQMKKVHWLPKTLAFFSVWKFTDFFFLIETRHKAGMEKKQKTKRRDDSEALMMIGLLCDQQE